MASNPWWLTALSWAGCTSSSVSNLFQSARHRGDRYRQSHRPSANISQAIGSAAAVVMFFTTLSFLFSTPGWELSLGGFPALSALPGQFLLKDVVLLG